MTTPEPPTTRRSLKKVEEADARQREALRKLAEADEETQRLVCDAAEEAAVEKIK